jgi:hypothetical protein
MNKQFIEYVRAYMPVHTVVKCNGERITITDAAVDRQIIIDINGNIIRNDGVRPIVSEMITVLTRALQ